MLSVSWWTLSIRPLKPIAILEDGSTLPCDLLICATGFNQDLAFLPRHVQKEFLDEHENLLLHKHILPPGVPNLTFNGYNSSLFCPTYSEAARLKLEWLDARNNGKHAHGTNLVPFSLHSIEDTLKDINLQLGTFGTIRQWLLPVRPSDYAGLGAQLCKRIDEANGAKFQP
ncbi:uncharacterized protein UBRO_20750 [Ustilago bromivora]|uniref:Uncharacterized protein n=1 Tax=Ustilago bromivora TaxID=307758 RepID=A0A1K0G6Q3_9BASI|nr:uncharacterized protein UBRO_20750 [Ustilago bromivora]